MTDLARTDQHADEPLGRRRAIPVVDLMAVAVILGVLSSLVGPQLSSASQAPQLSALRHRLDRLRQQIALYTMQHDGTPPGNATGAESDAAVAFVRQMTGSTDAAGRLGSASDLRFAFGPYLAAVPVNPLTGSDRVRIAGSDSALKPSGRAGWIYEPHTGRIAPDAIGRDTTGIAYVDY